MPGVARLFPFSELFGGFGVAGEIAESPVVVVEPVLAFCADTAELVSRIAVTAILASFI
jgi:hypothetical protein